MSRDILLTLIDPDAANARKHFPTVSLAELAASIGASGLAVPILLRPAGDRFLIVHGERRFRAVKSLGWQTIQADVRDIDADAASWLALVENVQRADLSPIEEAQAYQAKLSMGITQSELGRRIGKTQSHIATKLRFLTLPAQVQQALQEEVISEGHAKQLLRLKGEDHQLRICAKVIAEKMSVAELAKMMDDAIECEKLEDEIRQALDNLTHNFDILYHHVMPEQFVQFIQQHGELDAEIVSILEWMYSDRYYLVKGKALAAQGNRE